MEDKVKKGLLEAEKLVQKIKKKVKRNDLDYTIQAVLDSTAPGVVRYAVRVTPINEAVAPMVFVGDTIQELHDKIKFRLDNGLDEKEIELNYHESMIKNIEKTIEFHKARVEELKEEDEQDED